MSRTPQADWRTALPAKPARRRPATELVTLIDLPCTPEVPGIHLPWMTVDLRRHRASPSDNADASDSAELRIAGLPEPQSPGCVTLRFGSKLVPFRGSA